MQKFVLPERFEVIFQDQYYGKFAIYPFERGFGHTIGNSLRRVLLSGLEGAAITSCRIPNVSHEFSTIRGVKEDVIYILMNLKKVRMKMYSNGPEKITLNVKGPKEITAEDFVTSHNLEIVNKKQHIATVEMNGVLEMECEVNKGRGYAFAEENKRPGAPVDTLFIDSIFSPVTKVNYEVESTRVGYRTDYEKIILEIWVDGTISPEDSLIYSVNLLKDTLKIFFTKPQTELTVEEPKVSPEEIVAQEHMNQLLSQPIEIFEFSTRAYNCLKEARIDTVAVLISKSEEELKTIRNLGEKSLEEIKEKLKSRGLSLGTKI